MKNKSLMEQIETLLDNCIVQPSDDYNLANGRKAIFGGSDDSKPDIVEDPKSYKFVNRQVLALKALYLQQSKPNKIIFEKIIMSKLQVGEVREIGKVAVSVLFHIGHFMKILDYIQKNYTDGNQKIFISELDMLVLLICYEWDTLTIREVKELRDWIHDTFNGKNKLGRELDNYPRLFEPTLIALSTLNRQVNIILTKSIEEEIYSGFNPEVNEDEKKLKDEFNRYGFTEDLSESLQKIDQKFEAASDDFDFKGCMDLIRAFTERLYRSIAISLDSTAGKQINGMDSDVVAKFFIEKELISIHQGAILIALRHFLSNLAAHRLKSKPEDARLSRNMTIEFSLYLMRRLKALQP